MQRLDSLYIRGFSAGIRAVLAEGERPELWITPDGKLFFKNWKKAQNEI